MTRQLRIYLLRLLSGGGFEQNDAMVVIARDAREARELAASEARDELPVSWLRTDLSKVRGIGMAMQGAKPGVVLISGHEE